MNVGLSLPLLARSCPDNVQSFGFVLPREKLLGLRAQDRAHQRDHRNTWKAKPTLSKIQKFAVRCYELESAMIHVKGLRVALEGLGNRNVRIGSCRRLS